jgi:hypothetical protein
VLVDPHRPHLPRRYADRRRRPTRSTLGAILPASRPPGHHPLGVNRTRQVRTAARRSPLVTGPHRGHVRSERQGQHPTNALITGLASHLRRAGTVPEPLSGQQTGSSNPRTMRPTARSVGWYSTSTRQPECSVCATQLSNPAGSPEACLVMAGGLILELIPTRPCPEQHHAWAALVHPARVRRAHPGWLHDHRLFRSDLAAGETEATR